uniref:Uncharacterized protein n=1 Tax=Lepeophtheirus salmonis TaxID=72036 RepID=A0A0K2USR0_LEPSM
MVPVSNVNLFSILK